MHAQIAGRLTGRVTKWLVLVAWLVIAGAMGGLNAKLVDVQNNEASSWLPGSAESTQVADELSGTIDPNDIPTLVVYDKPGGLSDADTAQIAQQAQEMGGIEGVTGEVLPPTLIQAGGAEFLAADAHHIARMLEENGTDVTLEVWPGQLHVFQALPRISPESHAAVGRICAFARAALAYRAAVPTGSTNEGVIA